MMPSFDACPDITLYIASKTYLGNLLYYEGNLKDSNKANKNEITRWNSTQKSTEIKL